MRKKFSDRPNFREGGGSSLWAPFHDTTHIITELR